MGSTRANKRCSIKQILPIEYFNDKSNQKFVQGLIQYIDKHHFNLFSVIFSLGINILKKHNLNNKEHVISVLKEYSDVTPIKKLVHIILPENENDILGLVYQSYLYEGYKNIKGSYYTPLSVVNNMIKDLDFSNMQSFLDPCCGSGAFLTNVSVTDPNLLYGVDTDEIAVFISKINLLVKYKNVEFIPKIYCADFLSVDFVMNERFDYIITNPPWGALASNYDYIPEVTSKESFSYFFVKSYKYLKPNGRIRFLFPESVLNVKCHKDIRKFILDMRGLYCITRYGNLFTGVTTRCVDIECRNETVNKIFDVYEKNVVRSVTLSSIYETKNLIFSLLSYDDVSIVEKVKKRGEYSLQDSIWALGIVTGDNKRKLFSEHLAGTEKIYTGKDIQPFILKPPKNYIHYDRNSLQQVAKEEIYRAPEKLVYKFISSKLVFAYDDSASLFLNSANILIPIIPSMSTKSVLAFLNSTLFKFMYIKLFGEVKILKGNLSELPFPNLSTLDNNKLTALVNKVLSGNSFDRETIDNYIFNFYELNDTQIAYVKKEIR